MALAQVLWGSKHTDEALEHLRELLRLNPNDNQGVRTFLATALIQLGEFDEAEDLLTTYKETHSASWHYNWALLTFLKEGDGSLARRRLTAAFKFNPHVAPFLTGRQPLPTEQPTYYQPGDTTEAEAIIDELHAAWFASQGAITWITQRWAHFVK